MYFTVDLPSHSCSLTYIQCPHTTRYAFTHPAMLTAFRASRGAAAAAAAAYRRLRHACARTKTRLQSRQRLRLAKPVWSGAKKDGMRALCVHKEDACGALSSSFLDKQQQQQPRDTVSSLLIPGKQAQRNLEWPRATITDL